MLTITHLIAAVCGQSLYCQCSGWRLLTVSPLLQITDYISNQPRLGRGGQLAHNWPTALSLMSGMSCLRSEQPSLLCFIHLYNLSEIKMSLKMSLCSILSFIFLSFRCINLWGEICPKKHPLCSFHCCSLKSLSPRATGHCYECIASLLFGCFSTQTVKSYQ